ncbi:DUF4845 domain-containing protein [Candidatus Methylocalor cossyra]|uniref:DUF4845 domain-containing protein n=1 Tax=Candidatus Methylocalor cossyra TaxID=3108543 RepID=A0ABM9NFJ0_9GAMM
MDEETTTVTGTDMGDTGNRQGGMTFLGFLFFMALLGFFATLVLKIGPIYLNHFKVRSSLESLKNNGDLPSLSKQEIVSLLMKRWNIEMVDDILSPDNVAVTKEPDRTKVQVVYDVTKPIFGNIDVVVHFDDAIEVKPH